MKILDSKNTVLLILISTVFFSFVSFLSSVFPIWGNIPINILFPLIIVFSSTMVFFEKLKIYTLIVGKILVALVAFSILKEKWFIAAIVTMMYINVSEATITDFKNKRYLNVASGVALLATTYILFSYKWNIVNQSDEGIVNIGFYTTEYKSILYWILAYTLWNWNFVIGEFSPAIGKYHIAVLATPLVLCLIVRDPGLWWITRSSSLAFSLVLQIRFKERIEEKFQSIAFTKIVDKINTRSIQILFTGTVIGLSVLSALNL